MHKTAYEAKIALCRAEDFGGDLSARRTWLAGLPLPANDSDIEPVLGCPTLARLAKAGDRKRAIALMSWVQSMLPLHVPTSLNAANDNRPTEDGWEKAGWADPRERDTFDRDRIREIRPTENEIIAAERTPGVCRVSVLCTRKHRGRWTETRRAWHGPTPVVTGEEVHVGGLTFFRGKLWRYVSDGQQWAPRDILRGAKGRAKKVRSAADVSRYLARGGSPFPEQWRTHDGGRSYERSDSATAAHRNLAALGVDGSVPADRLPIKPTKLPPGIASGAHWIGGRTERTGRSGRSHQIEAAVEAEIARTTAAARARKQVSEGTVAILDLATTSMTAREIGVEFGFVGKYAERWAVTQVNKALDKIAA